MIIWCVEDDNSIRDIELYTLKSTGFQCRGFSSSTDFWAALKSHKPDLILLDIMLPEEDGVAILKKLRANSEYAEIPVIMATAKGMEYDKIQSLDLGADDYLVKPFGMMEMISRIKAVLRRAKKSSAYDSSKEIINIGCLSIDVNAHRVTLAGESVTLTYKEFNLLRLLAAHPNHVYTREQLFSSIWDSDYIGESRTIDMHIKTLRQKLGDYGAAIKTIRNVGYRLDVEEL